MSSPGHLYDILMAPHRKAIGLRVYKERTKRGWTQKVLADKCESYPIEICKIEHAKQHPREAMLRKLARAFDVTLFYLIHGVEYGDPLVNNVNPDTSRGAVEYVKFGS